MITEEEKKQILKNEERLWDLAAITAAPTFFQSLNQLMMSSEEIDKVYETVSKLSYELADALILERRRRLKEVKS